MSTQSHLNQGSAPDVNRFVLEDRDYRIDGVNSDHDAMALRMDQGYYDLAEIKPVPETIQLTEIIDVGTVAVRAERRKFRPLVAKLAAATIVLWRGT